MYTYHPPRRKNRTASFSRILLSIHSCSWGCFQFGLFDPLFVEHRTTLALTKTQYTVDLHSVLCCAQM